MNESVKLFLRDNELAFHHSDYNELFKAWRLMKSFRRPKLYEITEVLFNAGLNPLKKLVNVPSNFAVSNTKITAVEFPDETETIGVDAFLDCTGLQDANLDKIKVIFAEAFSNTGLTSVVLTNAELIDQSAFSHCQHLKSVVIGDKVTIIEDKCFIDCPELTSVTLGNAIELIGYSSFGHCPKLVTITIPESVKEIQSDAFGDCVNLKNITLPDSLEVISNKAFRNVTDLVITCSQKTKDLCEGMGLKNVEYEVI